MQNKRGGDSPRYELSLRVWVLTILNLLIFICKVSDADTFLAFLPPSLRLFDYAGFILLGTWLTFTLSAVFLIIRRTKHNGGGMRGELVFWLLAIVQFIVTLTFVWRIPGGMSLIGIVYAALWSVLSLICIWRRR